jgi:hypothetical protein
VAEAQLLRLGADDEPAHRCRGRRGRVSGGITLSGRPEGSKLWAELRRGDNLVGSEARPLQPNRFDCLHVSQELQKRGVNLFLLDVGASDPVAIFT